MIVVENALYTALWGDATYRSLSTNGLWPNKPPQTKVPPFSVFQLMSGLPYRVHGSAPVAWWDLTYLLRGTSKVDTTAAAAMIERADALLTRTALLSVSGYKVMECNLKARFSPYNEVVGAEDWWHVPAHFFIRISPTS